MVYAHVIYKKTGVERNNVTPKAYNLLKNQYTLLGWVDEKGNPVSGPQEVKTTQKKRVAERAVNEPRKQMSREEIEAKRAELKSMNEAAIQKAKDEQAKEAEKIPEKVETHPNSDGSDQVLPIQRRKPGRPKTNA